ncbi:MAG: S24/S26 family peptidase [Candidatus Aminicenantales bacterium]
MKTAPNVRKKESLPLSGESLTEIMRAVLAQKKPFRFRATGLSMSPFIKDGDVVTVRPLRSRPPRTGDIAAFLYPGTGKVAVHRIVREKSGRYSLKGDNVPAIDGSLPLDRILGTVSRVDRDGAKVGLGGRAGAAAIASLSRSGLLSKAVGAARRAGLRKSGRS